jgi:hypothetical protein
MSLSANQERGQDGRIAQRVVDAVAEAAGEDPLALPPLYDVVDPDAIESLFQPGAAGHVRFSYHGRGVIVGADGDITLDGDE